ncbi:MAG: Ig-like domain-containing protein, partial [Clostridiales bacterium]|nr:Ig-like domain-containing protein [Clostridiales bacterium]
MASQGIEEEEPLAVTETLAEEAVAEVEETVAEAETPSEQPAEPAAVEVEEPAAVEEPEATVEELPAEVPADEAEEVPSEAAEPEADPEAEEAAPVDTEPETADAENVSEEENELPAEALVPAAEVADAEIEMVPELNAEQGTAETVAEEDIGFESYAAPPVILVSSITLSGKTTMKAGESDYPTVTIAPETATNKGVSWTSVNPNVATVSADGVVYAVAEGN